MLFTSAEKLYQFVALKWGGGGGGGGGGGDWRKRQTWSWKKLSSCLELVGLALNRLLTVKSTTMMKVQFAGGAKNKFAAFPWRNQTQISFVVSWEKLLGWNLPHFNCSSRAFGGQHWVFFWRSFLRSLLWLRHFLPTEGSFGCVQNLCLRQNQRCYCKTWCAHTISGPTNLSNTVAMSKKRITSKMRTKSRSSPSCSRNEVICVVCVMQA